MDFAHVTRNKTDEAKCKEEVSEAEGYLPRLAAESNVPASVTA